MEKELTDIKGRIDLLAQSMNVFHKTQSENLMNGVESHRSTAKIELMGLDELQSV